eukprot:jgi/Ulvmu1/5675/UM024_0022.1
MSQGDVAFGHGHRFGDENAAFFGNVSHPAQPGAFDLDGIFMPSSCVLVGGTMLGRKAVAGCVGNADGLIGADKYGQESPGPVTSAPAIYQLRHWIPRTVVHCECVPHMHFDSIQQISELGSGTYGRVMKSIIPSWDPHIPVALKLAAPGREKDITHEAVVLSRLSHPRIIGIHSVVPSDEDATAAAAIATEVCEGGSLGDWLVACRSRAKANGSSALLPFQQRLDIAYQVLQGLQHSHNRGYAHLDIKPGNVLLRSGAPDVTADTQLCDFGLAEPINGKPMPGQYRGTWPYMAPEMVRNSRTAAAPALDVWSFGVLLWDLVSVTAPGSGLSGDQIKRALRAGKLYTGAGTGLPCEPEWRSLIARCLVYDPERRATVCELLADVAAVRALAAHRREAAQRFARIFGGLHGFAGAESVGGPSGSAAARGGPGSPRVQACWDGPTFQRTPSPAERALPDTLGLYVCEHDEGDASANAPPPLRPSRHALRLNLPETLGLCGPHHVEKPACSPLKPGHWSRGAVAALRGSSADSCGTGVGQENDRWGHLNLPKTSELWA